MTFEQLPLVAGDRRNNALTVSPTQQCAEQALPNLQFLPKLQAIEARVRGLLLGNTEKQISSPGSWPPPLYRPSWPHVKLASPLVLAELAAANFPGGG